MWPKNFLWLHLRMKVSRRPLNFCSWSWPLDPKIRSPAALGQLCRQGVMAFCSDVSHTALQTRHNYLWTDYCKNHLYHRWTRPVLNSVCVWVTNKAWERKKTWIKMLIWIFNKKGFCMSKLISLHLMRHTFIHLMGLLTNM